VSLSGTSLANKITVVKDNKTNEKRKLIFTCSGNFYYFQMLTKGRGEGVP